MKDNNFVTHDIIEQLKKAVRGERIALNLTQKEFAKLVELKYPTYRTFEQFGKISLENMILILIKLNKDIEFVKFIKGFEFTNQKERVRVEPKLNKKAYILEPIIPVSQKQITLDKQIFGNDLFYSAKNGQLYDVGNFISIILSECDDKRMMLLLKYFGKNRIKPYVLNQKNLKLLKMFNTHISFIEKV